MQARFCISYSFIVVKFILFFRVRVLTLIYLKVTSTILILNFL